MSDFASLHATPFHGSTAALNRSGAWASQGRFIVPAHYSEPHSEALAARTTAALFDFSFVERVRIHGNGAARLVSTAFAADMSAMETGEAREVIWRAAGGGVRGTGVLARVGENNFALRAFDTDLAWFARAARRFDASVRDATGERGVLLLVGPYAFGVLAAAGLESAAVLPRGRHAIVDWQGMTLTINHWHVPDGFEILCAREHAAALFDRLVQAGRLFDLAPAGQQALDILLVESGVAMPHLDYAPARTDRAVEPVLSVVGLEIAAQTPAPRAPVLRDGVIVGNTLRSVYSPALRRAIALAHLPAAHSATETRLTVRTLGASGTADVPARVVGLPFL